MWKEDFLFGRFSTDLELYCANNPHEASLLIMGLAIGFLIGSLVLCRRIVRLKRVIRQLQEERVVTSSSPGDEMAELDTPSPLPAEPEKEAEGVSELPAESTSGFGSLVTEVEVLKPAEVVEDIPSESRVYRGLKKTRNGFLARLSGIFGAKATVDETMLDDLEEALILSDVGPRCAADLVEKVSAEASKGPSVNRAGLESMLAELIEGRLTSPSADASIYHPKGQTKIFLVVGVNGVGKTTTVAKLASRYVAEGLRVMVIAADTFRAAAVQQLEEWSNRIGFDLVKGADEAKPGAVVFDGMVRAKEEEYDVVLIDTAGRLHTKSNLMQELQGIRNSVTRHFPDAPDETILVVDGVSGQNALAQAREFNSATELTGIIVTKLDGTPKGGIIVAISDEVGVPVYYIGVGEKAADLVPFKAQEFTNSLFMIDEEPKALSSAAALNT